jgi:hypothetical protein
MSDMFIVMIDRIVNALGEKWKIHFDEKYDVNDNDKWLIINNIVLVDVHIYNVTTISTNGQQMTTKQVTTKMKVCDTRIELGPRFEYEKLVRQ